MTKTKTTSTASKAKTYSEPVLAIVKILKENPNQSMSFAEITSLAGSIQVIDGAVDDVRKLIIENGFKIKNVSWFKGCDYDGYLFIVG